MEPCGTTAREALGRRRKIRQAWSARGHGQRWPRTGTWSPALGLKEEDGQSQGHRGLGMSGGSKAGARTGKHLREAGQ